MSTELHGKLVALLLVVSLVGSAQAAETGFIQVKCAPGVQIFMDGDLKGLTNADVGGLIIQDVKPGRHEIKAVKPGYRPQVESLTVKADQVVSFEVKPFIPKVDITEEGEEKETEVKLRVGTLQIQSVPIECTLTISRLGVDKQKKTKDRWQAKSVPIGKYTVTAEGLGKRLSHEVEVYESFTSELLFNFLTGEVKNLGEQRRAADLQARRAAEAEVAKLRAAARKLGITFPSGWAFVPIKPGTFTMGSPAGETNRDDDERQHTVRLTKSFFMSAYETTQAQYEELMKSNPSHFKGDKRPVEQVSWDDAQDFIRALNQRERGGGRLPQGWAYRLPTEAEWEYACRAGTNTAYCFGNGAGALGDYAWYNDNGGGQTHDVGGKKPNAWGLYDMHGNVYEWCGDWFGDYPTGAVSNPIGPTTGEDRVFRGGSWCSAAQDCRSASRGRITPGRRNYDLGFRPVLAPPG